MYRLRYSTEHTLHSTHVCVRLSISLCVNMNTKRQTTNTKYTRQRCMKQRKTFAKTVELANSIITSYEVYHAI